jgi:hypothetical protein
MNTSKSPAKNRKLPASQAQGAQERPPGKKKEKQMLRQHLGMEAMKYLVKNKEKADDAKELKKEGRFKNAFGIATRKDKN